MNFLHDWEHELLDTGIFNENRYFDVFVEYAKAAPTDILIQISAANRGPDPAELHVLPTLWFRNTWTWWPDQPKPSSQKMPGTNTVTIETSHAELGGFLAHCDGNPSLLFTENDTNNERIFGTPNATPYVKDADPGAFRAILDHRAQSARRFLPLFDHHLFVAPVSAISLWILVLFLIYVTASEFSQLFGPGELQRLFFTHRPSELQLNRRQRFRELLRLSRLTDEHSVDELRDSANPAHRQLIDVLQGLARLSPTR